MLYNHTMINPKDYPALSGIYGQNASDVMVLADVVGDAPVTLLEVMRDFLAIVPDPIIAGGFAVSHHVEPRGTRDIDVIAVGSIEPYITEFEKRGYKHETVRLSIGSLDMLTKGNKGVDFIQLDDSTFLSSIKNRTVPGIFLNQKVRIISIEDLILLKMMAYAERKKGQDQVDLDNLLARPHDQTYIDIWKKKLSIK